MGRSPVGLGQVSTADLIVALGKGGASLGVRGRKAIPEMALCIPGGSHLRGVIPGDAYFHSIR